MQKGNFSSWLYNKKLQDEYELAENEKLKRDIQRLSQQQGERPAGRKGGKTKFGRRNSGVKPDKGYVGHKAAKMMKRSKVAEGTGKSGEKRQNS